MLATTCNWFTSSVQNSWRKKSGSSRGRGSSSGRSLGWCFRAVALGCVFALDRLHHWRWGRFSFLHLHGQVTQHGIIELECGFQLDQGLVVAFDVHADVVRFWQLLDRVSHLATAPVFDAMNVTAACADAGLVTFD